MHHIQKYVLKQLTHHRQARFSEMRPPRTDTNVYSYHLQTLQKEGYIEKCDRVYTLSPIGLAYVERISVESFEPRMQPKVITMMIVRNDADQILLWQKSKQPFIETWSLLSGKVHLEDESIYAAVQREQIEKFSVATDTIKHRGDAYVRAYVNGRLVSNVLAHIIVFRIPEGATIHQNTRWFDYEEIATLNTAPATLDIINDAAGDTPFFFSEYNPVVILSS